MTQAAEHSTASLAVEVTGATSDAARRHIAEKVGSVARYSPRPVRRAHVTIGRGPQRPGKAARVSATLDVDGRTLYARAEANTVYEAVDTVRHRLLMQLSRWHRPLRARAYGWVTLGRDQDNHRG